MSLTDESVAVRTGSTGRGAVIVVDEFQERRITGEHLTDIVVGCVSAGEDVTGVHTDAEARVRETRDEVHELVVARENLRTLTSGSLEKERAGGRGVGKSRRDIGSHVLQSGCQRLRCVLSHMDHNTAAPHRYTVLEILDEERRMVVIRSAGRLTEIYDVLAVDEDVSAGLCDGRAGRCEFRVGDGHATRLRARQKDLVRAAIRQMAHCVDEALEFGHVAANEMSLTEEGPHECVAATLVLSRRGGLQECPVGRTLGPRADIVVPDRLLEGQNDVEIRRLGRECRVGEGLEEEDHPVFLEHACEFDLEDLRGCPHVGMPTDTTGCPHLGLELELPACGEAEFHAGLTDVLQEGLRRLGGGDLGEGGGGQCGTTGRRNNLEARRGDLHGWKVEEILRNPA